MISLPEPLLRRLRVAAAERGVSMATIVREAVEQKLDERPPKPRSLGIADSGYIDTSSLAGEQRPEPRSWR